MDNQPKIAFVGFGEAAQAFVSGWDLADPSRIAAYDIKTDDPAARQAMRERYRMHGVRGCDALADALAGAAIVFSVVTADRALEAAAAAAPLLGAGAFWLDCNSCAPGTKQRAAEAIDARGARYVDVAVMAPVHPKRHLVPLLVSGPHAREAADALRALGMKPVIAGPAVGEASSIKMIRSVMVKGIEALTAECFLAARRAGVEAQVIASLDASDPAMQWRRRGAYNLERMMVHGARRAAEMREVAATVEALGLAGRMSAAAAQWQADIAALHAEPGDDDFSSRAERILSRL